MDIWRIERKSLIENCYVTNISEMQATPPARFYNKIDNFIGIYYHLHHRE